ncbi:hypothetical protein [Shewanella woodyi]
MRLLNAESWLAAGPLEGAFGMAKKSLFIGYPLKHVRAIPITYAG